MLACLAGAAALGCGDDDDAPGTDAGPRPDSTVPVDGGPCPAGCADPTPICRESDGTCVACLDHAACTDPAADRCSAEGRCVGCAADEDCAERAATPVCDEPSGRCVACTPDSEMTTCAGGDELACHPTDLTCTGAPRGTLASCQPCISDSECSVSGAEVRRCVPFSFGGAELGSFCFLDQASAAGTCPARFAEARMGTSVLGVEAMYCVPRATTCGGLATVSRSCAMDSECGAEGVDDALCRDDGGGMRCTYECAGDEDCAGSLCSTATPRYCCTAGTGPGCS